ncbi:MAG TPA: hypothetical protein VM532_14245 [Burkholderiales bacterium]|nr:hypothetical protein [Burkholderiales bacterium]
MQGAKRAAVPFTASDWQRSSAPVTARQNGQFIVRESLSIPVKEPIDEPVCSGWSEKEGVIYTQPPTSILETLVAIRIHIDEPESNNRIVSVALQKVESPLAARNLKKWNVTRSVAADLQCSH